MPIRSARRSGRRKRAPAIIGDRIIAGGLPPGRDVPFSRTRGRGAEERAADAPHGILMWPVSAAASGLPTRPNPGGVYVMFDGTPYAHLMIYQDPKLMK